MNNQVTYNGMLWLLAAQLVVMLPLAWYLPLWLIPVMLVATAWRLKALKTGAEQPNPLIKFSLVALGILGLIASGLKFPSLEAMSALLLLSFAFKSLEVVNRRDALVVIFIGYFLVALYFLYTQSMLAALYGVVSLVVLTGTLIAVQQSVAAFSTAHAISFNLRLAVFMLLQCLPLMVGIFVLAPRLQPLWTLPVMANQAKTGISDHMAPGDIEQLSKSSDLAFRVSFKHKVPSKNELYWRGLVLNYFDGREWRQFEEQYDLPYLKNFIHQQYAFQPQQLWVGGDAFEYEAIYEKTGQPWLFTLTPTVKTGIDTLAAADYRIMADQPLQAPFLLKATAYSHAARDKELAPAIKQLALQLPLAGNQRTRELASQLFNEAQQDETAYIQKVLNRYQQQQFAYTLRPPALGDTDTIDSFLFDAKRGFCAHYAGSFVFLMRAVGIPARVVVGYQGGEWNERGDYLAVHQYDAHAWAEVWQADKGWIQMDPTTMVAPERIEQGLEAAVRTEGSFLEGQFLNIRSIPWLNALRQKIDATQYGWQRWVLGYDHESQSSLFKALFGDMSVTRMAALVTGLIAAVTLLWVLVLGLARKRSHEALEHQLYRQFCALLAKQGVERPIGLAPGPFAQQAISALPAQADLITEFTQRYETLCYVPHTDSTQIIRRLKQLLAKLR